MNTPNHIERGKMPRSIQEIRREREGKGHELKSDHLRLRRRERKGSKGVPFEEEGGVHLKRSTALLRA